MGVKQVIRCFLEEESGASVVEYAALASIISIAAIATIYVIGLDLDAKFSELLELINEQQGGG